MRCGSRERTDGVATVARMEASLAPFGARDGVVRGGRAKWRGRPRITSSRKRDASIRATYAVDALFDRLAAVHRRATQVHRRDAARILDVVQWVGVEHDEVGALAPLQRA